MIKLNLSKKGKYIIVFILILIVAVIIKSNNQENKTTLCLGIFVGSNWDVPNWQSYRIFDEAIEEFERRNPDIKVVYRSGTLKSDYSEWLAQKIVKGEEPDVFAVLSTDFNTLASIGILKKLDKLIVNDNEFNLDLMYSNAVQLGQLNGYQYALPCEVSPTLMFVNKTLLESENIPIPDDDWTWDEFYKICERIKKDTNGDGLIDQFGTTSFTWKDAVYTNGQQLFNEYGTQAFFNSPGVLESIRFAKKLNDLNVNSKMAGFDSGKVAFAPFPFSAYRAYKYYPYRVKYLTNFEWECIKLPKGPNGRNASELLDFSMGISARTKNTEAAWKFLKFITSDEVNQLNVFRYSHGVPVRRDVVESMEAEAILGTNGKDNEKFIDTKTLSQVIEESTVTPRFQKYEEVMNMADKEIFQLINSEKNLKDSLSTLNREIELFLRK